MAFAKGNALRRFTGMKHRPESNAKRSATIKRLYATGKANPNMGWPKYSTEEERRRGRLSAQLKCRYGISIDDYEAMYEKQGGYCRICQQKFPKLHVDHCHVTGRVRALLCSNCNKALGFVEKVGGWNVFSYQLENF